MIKRKRGRTKNPPTDLPSRWLRSKTGRAYSYVIETDQKNHLGQKLYKLQSLMYDFRSDRTGKVQHLQPSSRWWTREELEATGTFLKNPPTKAMILKAKTL